MLQTINCIRMGQILLDENLQLFILCNNCHIDLRDESDFRRHLEKCDGVESNFFRGEMRQLKFSTEKSSTQLFGKTAKGIKEFLIYDYTDVDLEFMKAEEHFIDLLNIDDPKWYSDFNSEVNNTNITEKSSKQYDVLVEEVTPFVQFKENAKNNIRPNKTEILTEYESSFTNVTKKKEKTSKRRLSVVKVNNGSVEYPRTKERNDFIKSSTHMPENSKSGSIPKRCKIKSGPLNGTTKLVPILANSTACSSTSNSKQIIACAPKPSMAINPLVIVNTSNQPTKEKETARILNKLQNLGLQIKRTAGPPAVAPKADDKILEICIAKLQSKGMKVKLVNKQRNNVQEKSSRAKAFVTMKQHFNKNLIIRKVN